MTTLLTEEVASWIGKEKTYTALEELGRASIRYFAMAVGDENPIYYDDQFARSCGLPGVIAPPTMVVETGQYMSGVRSEIGHTWEIPVEGCRMIRGGNEYSFSRPVLPTDVISASWRIEDIKERASSSDKPMLIVTSLATYTNQDGDSLATNRETLIFQKTAKEA